MLLFGGAVEQGVHVHRHSLIVWLWFVKSPTVEYQWAEVFRQTKTFIAAVKAHFLVEIWARPANSAKSLKNTIKNKERQEWHDDTPTCEWVVRSVQLSGVWQTLILTRGFHASLPLSSFRITKLNLQDLCEPQFIYDFSAFTPDCMSLFYEHQSVWAANKWTTETQKSLFFALINSAASTVWRTSVGLRFKCTADFNFLPNIQSPPASWSVYRCPCKDANRERERGKPSKLGGVMKQKRECHSRGMWECVPTNLCLALWWMVSPWTWAARHPNTCGSISCQLHVLGLAQQSKRMTHSYFFKVEKIFEYYLHECAPWRHHAIAAFCRL